MIRLPRYCPSGPRHRACQTSSSELVPLLQLPFAHTTSPELESTILDDNHTSNYAIHQSNRLGTPDFLITSAKSETALDSLLSLPRGLFNMLQQMVIPTPSYAVTL